MNLRSKITTACILLIILGAYVLVAHLDHQAEQRAQTVNPASPLYSLACPIADHDICEKTLKEQHARR